MDLTALDQMNTVLCLCKGENKMNVYKHEEALSLRRGGRLQYIKAKEGYMKVGHCTTILTPSVLVHAKGSKMVYMQMTMDGKCKGQCI